jgi:hypothetical protein
VRAGALGENDGCPRSSLGVIGAALILLASLVDRARALQAELDGIV